jgi:3-oxoacyl-[acyl-carrier protein] reductase
MRNKIILITGTSRGIGRYLAEYYENLGFFIIGCSRRDSDLQLINYEHFILDVGDEEKVKNMFKKIRKKYKSIDILINNAGIASMNHSMLTSMKTIKNIFSTNVFGTFLFCRESVKIMKNKTGGRIINFSTVAVPLKLEGEAAYASSKAAVVSLTQILAKELASYKVTVNAIGPTPVKTDLINSVPKEKIQNLLDQQVFNRFGKYEDIANVTDFFIKPESDFITGQIIYLGGL